MDDTTVDDQHDPPGDSDSTRRAIAHLAHLLRPGSPHADAVYQHHLRGGLECEETDPEVFFPAVDDPNRYLKVDLAKAICGRCPAKTDCLLWAIDTGQDYGWWGGVSMSARGRHRARDIAEALVEAS